MKKPQVILDLSEAPGIPEEAEAEKFADKASYDISSYFLRKAIQEYSSLGNWEKVIQNYIRLGNNYRLEGNYELALKYLNMGLEVALTHSGYKYSELADSYHKLAFKHFRSRDYEKALDLYQKALAVRISAFGRYHKEVSRSYNSIALVYRNMGNFKEADEYYYKSLLIKLRRFENIDDEFFRNFKFIDSNRVKQKFYSEAKRLLGKSLKVYLETYGGSHHLSGIIYENIGIIHTLEGDFERAMVNFRKALRIRTDLFGEDSLEVADTYHDIGTAFILKNEYDQGEKFLKDSLAVKKSKLGSDHLFNGDTYFQLGKLYFLTGNYDRALESLQGSLASMIGQFRPASLCDNPVLSEELYFKRDLLRVLNLKAEVFHKRSLISIDRFKDLECAFRSYMKSVELVEIMRNQYTPDEYNQGFETVSREAYGNGLKVSMELFRLTGDESYRVTALKLSERSKAALLWGMITDSEAKDFAGIPEKTLETESRLRNEIVRLEILLERDYLSSNLSPVRREALETAYFETRSRYQKFIDNMGKEYPRYFELRYRNRVPDIEEIKAGLQDDEALIEYFMSEDRINIFLITSNGFISREVQAEKDFSDTINDFYRSIVKIEESSFLKTSPVLYNSLIRPVAEYIRGRKKLIIIPDGELYLVPFEALIPEPGGNIPFSDLNFLIKEHSFSYHYSIILRDSRAANGKHPPNRNFLGVAPVFKWKAGSAFDPVLKTLPKLPGTAEEVRSIMELFTSKGIGNIGFFYGDATETKFKKVLKEQEFGFIHIATHTLNNTENPAYSGLIFAGDPEVPEEEDGVLFSKEIYNLKLKTPLLVLSSCESGAGKLVKGEGVLALNRGFFYAGAQNIIFSLWNVEDRSTSKLMVELYRKILEGKRFYDSLREAKLTLIADPYTAFPKYWSAFILFGE